MPRAKEIVSNMFDDEESARLKEEREEALLEERKTKEEEKKVQLAKEKLLYLEELLGKTSVDEEMLDLGKTFLQGRCRIETRSFSKSCLKHNRGGRWYGESQPDYYTPDHEHELSIKTLIYESSHRRVKKSFFRGETSEEFIEDHEIMGVGLANTKDGKLIFFVSPGFPSWEKGSCIEKKENNPHEGIFVKNVKEAALLKGNYADMIAKAFYKGCKIVFKENAPQIFDRGRSSDK